MNTRHALAAICAAAVLALTACTSAGSSGPTPTPKPAAIDTTPATDPTPTADDMTQTIVDLSWDQQTEADKDSMCFGLALYGTDWGAEQMRIGAGNESVDWDKAAQLVEVKCAQR
jgi:ABC-type Fe3+-hydroxamate transport system substrate-binding protein